MIERVTVITRKGQITLPADIRRALKLKQGDKVVIAVGGEQDSQATLKPFESVVDRLFGAFHTEGPPADLKALRRQFEEDSGRQAAQEGMTEI